MKLIVGLGNIGKEYTNTRHNIGFMVIDEYSCYKNVAIDKKKFNGLYGKFVFNDEVVILLKPCSYMNLSGEVIKKFIDFFKISLSDVLIINDDLDLDFCKIKLKLFGSCAGHNGLRNIEQCLGTTKYKRFKIGISNDKNVETKDYVLGKFSKSELNIINQMFVTTNSILDDFLSIDFERLMSKYN